MADDSFEQRLKPAAERIDAEAIGEPGSRRFRILAIVDSETHIIWLEKEQLRRLSDALIQVLAALPETEAAIEESSALPFATNSRSQFRAGRMELGYEEPTGRILLVVHDIEAESDETAAFVCSVSRGQAATLAANSEAVIAAGRPICPLCGQPMSGEDHACVKQNGHFPHHLDEVEPDEES
jgi:uncharacterized repeat protein (TIGR03847 family)